MNKNNSYTDKEIINGIIDENDDVLLYIYKNSYRPVRHLITTNSGNEEDARDIFQEALVILYKKLKSDDLKLYCSVSTFIYSIARLLWLKELKLRGKEISGYNDYDNYADEDSNVIKIYEYNERLSFYRRIFEQLSEDCKKILQLVMRSYTISEITKIMGYSSEQHTKNRRYRCKKALINRIMQNPEYYELKNEVYNIDREIPGWYTKR
ncbi:MAG: RNA polymerase sigma factor [Bacteroidales bacterium]|nr:MAG: RNA polymerase sigma factor [Bacteroidales bacterium]